MIYSIYCKSNRIRIHLEQKYRAGGSKNDNVQNSKILIMELVCKIRGVERILLILFAVQTGL